MSSTVMFVLLATDIFVVEKHPFKGCQHCESHVVDPYLKGTTSVEYLQEFLLPWQAMTPTLEVYGLLIAHYE